MAIEDDIVPETVHELQLIQRIQGLKRDLWEKGVFGSSIPTEVTTQIPPPPTLVLAASVEAGWESDTKFFVHGFAGTGTNRLAASCYTGKEALDAWTIDLTAKHFARLYQQILQQVVKEIARGNI